MKTNISLIEHIPVLVDINPELIWAMHVKGFWLFLVLVSFLENAAFILHQERSRGEKKKEKRRPKEKILKLFTI